MRHITLGLVLASFTVAACSSSSNDGDPLAGDAANANTPAASENGACVAPIAGADPSGFPVCKGTKGTSGRCVPRKALGAFADTFEQATCAADQGCVPDEVVKSGSNLDLKKCTAILDSEGRCFWPLAKDIVDNYDLLKGATKDQCPADQVCAPCINPLTKETTHVCDMGAASAACDSKGGAPGGATGGGAKPSATCPQKDPIVDTSSFKQEECTSNMLCVPTAAVDASLAKSLAKCTDGVCAPKKSVERAGNYVPPTCRSIADAEGRCLNVGIPSVAAQKDILPQTGCDADERCAPCFNPADGSNTAACNTASCDAPKEPAKTFASCCNGRARCVPTASVDADTQSLLQAKTCKAGAELCAPAELVGVPGVAKKKCSILGFVDGICLSSCAVDAGGLGGLAQGDCASGDLCAPCDLLPNGSCN
jgi:hypothetical protein